MNNPAARFGEWTCKRRGCTSLPTKKTAMPVNIPSGSEEGAESCFFLFGAIPAERLSLPLPSSRKFSTPPNVLDIAATVRLPVLKGRAGWVIWIRGSAQIYPVWPEVWVPDFHFRVPIAPVRSFDSFYTLVENWDSLTTYPSSKILDTIILILSIEMT